MMSHRGKGRAKHGKGRGSSGQGAAGAWSSGPPIPSGSINKQLQQETNPSGNKRSGERKFEDACKEINQSVQRYIATHQFEDDQEEEDEADLEEEKVLARVLKKYDENEKLGRTHQFLQDAFKRGALVCLICIENVKRIDPIWSCSSCSTSFHIHCVQKWAKDSLFLQAECLEQKGQQVDRRTLKWCCPKCRSYYAQSSVPASYFCFCGKKKDPPFDPWLIPHSCGEHCNHELRPACGHSCLLLCHPGPCPPCPKTVKNTCYCGKEAPQIRRCSSKQWSCGKPCRGSLSCGQHLCEVPCHDGDCLPCPRKSNQKCLCKGSSKLRPCADPAWQCDKVCGNRYDCGHHICEVVCHEASCGECPASGIRTCPCGKTSHQLPCTLSVPTCGDTCTKQLICGMHECTERCHKGPCPSCLHFLVKSCRCGTREKEMACSKEFTCETKCKKLRDCGRHLCNRKCCTGECLPCEVTCGKTLVCGNHKCESRCHQGMCYPCPLTFTLSCRCQETTITVPCGRERTTKPPKCGKMCRLPPDCHHPVRKEHKCHQGACPRCRFVCNVGLNCGHKCPDPCHDAVPVKVVDQRKRAGPWEKAAATYIEIQKKPCPPCMTLVSTRCYGRHENPNWPCSDLRPYSCGRECGRLLACTNHMCQRECHTVEGALDHVIAGKNCAPCERQCSKTRPKGCNHECRKPCHSEDCPKCTQSVRISCHCTISHLYINCQELRTASDNEKEILLCCKNQCNKLINCGHWCQKECHSGECSRTEDCKKRVPIRCLCKRQRKDFLCHLIASGAAQLLCDDVCRKKIEEKQKALEDEVKRRKEDEDEKQRKELEEFERKMEGKKRRQRNRRQTDSEPEMSFWDRRKYYFIFPLLIIILSSGLYFITYK